MNSLAYLIILLAINIPLLLSTQGGGLMLPFTGTVVSGTPAFSITNAGGSAGFFQINNPLVEANSLAAQNLGTGNSFFGLNTGGGRAGFFQIDNASNNKPALEAQTNGSGRGISAFTTGGSDGIYGESGKVDGRGMHGVATRGIGGVGVLGESSNGAGVRGNTSTGFGVLGDGGQGGVGVAGQSKDGFAGKFFGRVDVVGTLSKSSGAFKIDHPLDPENKYLYHSFVESPDMMNIYNGNAILNGRGEAAVNLPEWFEALNKDFRYQLTCIGGFAPIYIAEKIAGNRFRIAGGRPGMEVSWQVTGIRQDPYAEKRRIPVEEEKAEKERGFYLHPEAYGQPEEKRIQWIQHPEMNRKLRKGAS